jgi:actin-like ATPase involved in cell morphogenesis
VLITEVLTAVGRTGSPVPADVRLTYPVHWKSARCGALRAAARQAGLANVSLVPEPIAAVKRLGREKVPERSHVAILDIGATGVRAAVVRRSPDGLQVIGPPGVRQHLGGADIDQLIVEHLGRGLAGRQEAWGGLLAPADEASRQASMELRAAVQKAKHVLSGELAAQVVIGSLGLEIQLTRPELERLMLPVITEAVDLLADTITAAGLQAAQLAAVYLVGGSSQIPLVADMVWECLQVQPEVAAKPEAAVAFGAAAGVAGEHFERGSHFRGRLAGATTNPLWRHGCAGTASLFLQGDGVLVRVTDSPAQGPDVAALAAAVEARLKAGAGAGYVGAAPQPVAVLKHPNGLERAYTMLVGGQRVAYLDRYLQLGERWLVISGPASAREVTDRLVIEPVRADPARFFELRIGADVPEGWLAAERIELVRNRSGHGVIAESYPAATDVAAWYASRFPAPRYTEMGRGKSAFLGSRPADTVTFRDNAEQVVTRVWSGVIDGCGYRTIVTVPRAERLALPLLEGQMLLT